MKKIFYIIALFLITSCKKYLDKSPNNSLAYPTTVDNLQAMLDYSEVMNGTNLYIGSGSAGVTPSYAEASADDYFVSDATLNNFGDYQKPFYLWQLPAGVYQNLGGADWGALYAPIYSANVAIEQIDKITRTSENSTAWGNVKGSAYFFRGYYFLQLVWTFAKAYDPATASSDLGIVLRKTSDINVPSVRSTVEDSYSQVIEDAKVAVENLPEDSQHPLRPSKCAAYGLLARAYLSMRNYDSSLKYSNLSLQIKSSLINYNGDGDIVANLLQPVSPFRKYNKETIFYSQTTLNFLLCNPDLSGYIDTILYQSYEVNDLRRTAFFKAVGNYQTLKGNYSQETNRLFSGITTAEVLLIRAESYARKDNKDAAMNDLNTLLINRWKQGTFIPLTAANASDALDKILTERRKELLMRDLRWIDIKRLNKEGRNIILRRIVGGQQYELQPNNNRYALAIAPSILQQTGMPQNPGW
jgi:hypothetical protein